MKRNLRNLSVAFFLTVATVFVTGCKMESSKSEPEDPLAEKGSWINFSTTSKKEKDPLKLDYYFNDADSNKLTFLFNEDDYEKSGTLFDNFTYGSSSLFYYAITDENVIGFDAVVTKKSGDSSYGYGFNFYCTDDLLTTPYILLTIRGTSYRLITKISGETKGIRNLSDGWKQCDAIKPVGEENHIRAVTLNNGDIKFYINDELIQTVSKNEVPKFPGIVHLVSYVGYDDIYTSSGDIKTVEIEYQINKFQK